MRSGKKGINADPASKVDDWRNCLLLKCFMEKKLQLQVKELHRMA